MTPRSRQAKQELSELNNEKAQAQAILNKPANRGIADQSEFLNELFARKSLSWTRIFSEMERIMPPNIHVVSMKPDYTLNNELVVHMVVATDSRDRAVELVKRMEKSSHFRGPQIVAENVTTNSSDQGAGPGNIQFDIASVYVPADRRCRTRTRRNRRTQKNAAPAKSAGKTPAAGTANHAPHRTSRGSTNGDHSRRSQSIDAGDCRSGAADRRLRGLHLFSRGAFAAGA